MNHTVHGSAISMIGKKMFYYVYVLKSQKDKKFYIGYTHNLRQRFKEHQEGIVTSTKPRAPLDLIFCEAYRNRYDAMRREKYFKTSKGKTTLKQMLKKFLEAKR
ncbi:MAG: GIY-YIG nuclease family protein [Candidatus Zixiibacteriota bacterium]